MKFRKKPVVIEAFQWNPFMPTKVFPSWFTEALVDCNAYRQGLDVIIKTLEGDHRAELGDWIIQGVKGELYPCKPDIFAMTYETADVEKVI